MARAKKNGNGNGGGESIPCAIAPVCPVQPTLQMVLDSQERLHDRFARFEDERRDDHEIFRSTMEASNKAFHAKLEEVHKDLYLFRSARLAVVGLCSFIWTALKRALGVSA